MQITLNEFEVKGTITFNVTNVTIWRTTLVYDHDDFDFDTVLATIRDNGIRPEFLEGWAFVMPNQKAKPYAFHVNNKDRPKIKAEINAYIVTHDIRFDRGVPAKLDGKPNKTLRMFTDFPASAVEFNQGE
jgi:hypothetical protein